MPVIPFETRIPELGPDCFVAPDAWIIGNVLLGANTTVLFGTVVRGDIERITIGDNTNLQEHAVLHTSSGLECLIGSNVTVGHGATLHSCTVQDNCIVGMGATILDGAVIGKNSIIGAQSLVKMNTIVPEESLVVGVPASIVRKLKKDEIQQIAASAEHYVGKGRQYLVQLTA